MTTLILTPEETDRTAQQLHLVTTGLAPTEDVPGKTLKGSDTPPAYARCACGQLVLVGLTTEGNRLALDTSVKTYAIIWLNGEPTPRLRESAGYPVHRCLRLERSL